MFSFLQKNFTKPKKPEHERLATATHYRELTTFLLLIVFFVVGIMANFVSAFYDATHSKQPIIKAGYSADLTASSTPGTVQ